MTNQACKVKRNSLNKSDEDVKLEPMSKNTTDLREQIQNICDKYGYFLGLAYEGEDGSLKTHEKGKVVDELEALISHREKLAYRNGYAAGNAKKNYRKKVDVETLEQLKTEITADVLAMLRKAEL